MLEHILEQGSKSRKISCTNLCLFEADFCDFEHKLILINTQYGIMVFTAKGG